MRVGRTLGYAAAIAGGLLAATAWAAAAQNPCTPDYHSGGLSFGNCDNPDQTLAIPAETACNNLYTQGYWSDPSLAGGAGEHTIQEANLIHAGLNAGNWSTTGVVGGINWQFDAATETVETPWGYEDPALISHTIATYTTIIENATAALAIVFPDPHMSSTKTSAEEARRILQDLQASGHHVPYYTDLPYWVDRHGATPPSFDPSDPTHQDVLDPLPESIIPSVDVGIFTTRPLWDPTLTPALEILKCEGWTATDFTASPLKYDDAGIYCPSLSGWTYNGRDYSSGICRYSQRYWVSTAPPPGAGYYATRRTTRNWTCQTRSQSITIDGTQISRSLPGTREINTSTSLYSCRYTFPRSVLNNFSSQLDQFDVDLGTSTKPAVSVTVGHDITADTSGQATTPIGWAVRWTEHAIGGTVTRPSWATFVPDVRMSPRLDQLLVGKPTWVWMNQVIRSCLPDALPTPPAPDCDRRHGLVWETWPGDETDPNTWRHSRNTTNAGTIWRAVFPQRISIELTHNTTLISHTYECWTDDHGRTLAAGEWAPGQRPFESDPTVTPARTGPLATTLGPLNPGVGDCTFVHNVAGPHTATITIHWIGKEGLSPPTVPTTTLTWGEPPVGQEPADTIQTVPVVYYELHTIPGP